VVALRPAASVLSSGFHKEIEPSIGAEAWRHTWQRPRDPTPLIRITPVNQRICRSFPPIITTTVNIVRIYATRRPPASIRVRRPAPLRPIAAVVISPGVDDQSRFKAALAIAAANECFLRGCAIELASVVWRRGHVTALTQTRALPRTRVVRLSFSW
jgi:hypothetical protein